MNRLKTILVHLLFWLCVPIIASFFVWFFLRSTFSIENHRLDFLEVFLDKGNILSNFIVVFIGAFGFYTVYYLIAPYILRKAKAIKISLGIIALLLLPAIFLYVLRFFFQEIDQISFFIAYPILVLFSIIGALFRVWKYGRIKNMENAQLERKTLETQLNLLKSQINPHFLFNTINNIDVLIESKPKVASDYLRKLGDLLRFMLYRVNEEDKIPLEDEIEYLRKYIDLQKIRSINPNFVNFTIEGNPSSIPIAPMIFIVFVENAFKHVGDKKKDKAIELKMSITPNKLCFKSRNTIKKIIGDKNGKEGGIGLTSVKQRLDLIYKDYYELDIRSDGEYYETTLQIELP